MTEWTDRLAEKAVLEMVRSTTEKHPRRTWAQWERDLENRRRSDPRQLVGDLRKIASGDLMQKATVTRDTILDAAAFIESIVGTPNTAKATENVKENAT